MKPPITFDVKAYIAYIDALRATHTILPATSERMAMIPRAVRIQHDVDLSVECAFRMAKVEAKAGISAAYYFRVQPCFYDFADPDTRDLILQIGAMGHGVGLHLDPRTWAAEQSGMAADDRRFREVLHLAPCGCTQHKPRQGGKRPFGVSLNGEVYLSDSARAWSRAAAALLERPPDRLRLNLHPEWWMHRCKDRRAVVDACYAQGISDDRELADWATLEQHPSIADYDALVAAA